MRLNPSQVRKSVCLGAASLEQGRIVLSGSCVRLLGDRCADYRFLVSTAKTRDYPGTHTSRRGLRLIVRGANAKATFGLVNCSRASHSRRTGKPGKSIGRRNAECTTASRPAQGKPGSPSDGCSTLALIAPAQSRRMVGMSIVERGTRVASTYVQAATRGDRETLGFSGPPDSARQTP